MQCLHSPLSSIWHRCVVHKYAPHFYCSFLDLLHALTTLTHIYLFTQLGGILITFTGYLRASFYGKGWDFYQHEPVFWFKMFLLAVMGASSFFVTTQVIVRSVARANTGEFVPPSPKLVKRMVKIINGELLAILAIPLSATIMSRGIGYMPDLPWQLGAAPAALALFGLGFKYIKEALTWKEDDNTEEVEDFSVLK